MTYTYRRTWCSTCNGSGILTDRDAYGFIDSRCDDCSSGRVDASCAWCDRIVPLDDEGYCEQCMSIAPVIEIEPGRVAA